MCGVCSTTELSSELEKPPDPRGCCTTTETMGVGCHSHRNYLLAMSGSNYLLVCLRGSLGALGGPWGALGEVFNPAKDPTVS